MGALAIIRFKSGINQICDEHSLFLLFFFSVSHIRDILRKSYGDEGPSRLGADAVLDVPKGM